MVFVTMKCLQTGNGQTPEDRILENLILMVEAGEFHFI